jgi:hypothetical protein
MAACRSSTPLWLPNVESFVISVPYSQARRQVTTTSAGDAHEMAIAKVSLGWPLTVAAVRKAVRSDQTGAATGY